MAETDRRRDDIWTVASIGALAYLSADLAHHLAGHGGACLALGGRLLAISAIALRCSLTGAPVDIAGPLANLAVGLACLAAASRVRARPGPRLLLLLAAGFNLFWLEGQLVFSAATMTDDWAELLRALHPAAAWRWAFVALGAVGYLTTVRSLSRLGGGFAGADGGRLGRLVLIAYGAAGATAVLTGLRDPGGLHALVRHAGPQALILPLGLLFVRAPPSTQTEPSVRRSLPVIALALALAAGSVAFLGPGVLVQRPAGPPGTALAQLNRRAAWAIATAWREPPSAW